MEKQILIPIIVVLGILTLGIGIYIYIRCKTKPVETLQEVVITEEINQKVENSTDNSTNVCNNITIPVCDAVVIEGKQEDLDRIVQVGKLRMTERARRELENAWKGVKQSYSTMMNNRIAAFDRLEQGCVRSIEAGNRFIEAGNRFIEAGNNRIQAGNRFIAHCDNLIQHCNNSIVFGTLALGMSAVSVGDETNENNLNVG